MDAYEMHGGFQRPGRGTHWAGLPLRPHMQAWPSMGDSVWSSLTFIELFALVAPEKTEFKCAFSSLIRTENDTQNTRMESKALRVCKTFLGTAGFKKCDLKRATSLLSEKSPPKHKVSENRNRNRTLSSKKWRVICNPESKQARKGVKGQAASLGRRKRGWLG